MSMQQGAIDFSCDVNTLVVAPSAHVKARETSALAAVQAQPYRTKANAELLALITAAGEAGMSDEEIRQATGLPRQTICLRRFDLRAFLTPSTRRAKSQAGRSMVCWRRKTEQEMRDAS